MDCWHVLKLVLETFGFWFRKPLPNDHSQLGPTHTNDVVRDNVALRVLLDPNNLVLLEVNRTYRLVETRLLLSLVPTLL